MVLFHAGCHLVAHMTVHVFDAWEAMNNTLTLKRTKASDYASVGGAPEAYSSQFVCVCVSVTRDSWRPLQAMHCRVQCRHNATISQT